jgi:hypothetical protein
MTANWDPPTSFFTSAPFTSGSFGLDSRALRSERLRWLNNLSGKPTVPPALFRKVLQFFGRGRWTPCDLGLCKNEPEYKIAAFLKLRQRFSGKPDSFPGVGGCQALSHTTQPHHHLCIGRLEARTELPLHLLLPNTQGRRPEPPSE